MVMFCFLFFHCYSPSIQNNVKQIADTQKYLLNEWMDGWMSALLTDNNPEFVLLSSLLLNEKTDVHMVK